jgi:hypothetical protein
MTLTVERRLFGSEEGSIELAYVVQEENGGDRGRRSLQ